MVPRELEAVGSVVVVVGVVSGKPVQLEAAAALTAQWEVVAVLQAPLAVVVALSVVVTGGVPFSHSSRLVSAVM